MSGTLKKRYGIVAILDALGISSLNLSDCMTFIAKRDSIIETLKKVKSPLIKKQYEGMQILSEPEFYTFGDSIVVVWDLAKQTDMPAALLPAIEWLRPMLSMGILQKHILFRGALSFGHFITDKNTVLGPAVADAASWYSRADWFGVIATPTLNFSIDYISEEMADEKLLPWLFKYSVPMKGMNSLDAWTISWPYEFWGNRKGLNPIKLWSCLMESGPEEQDKVLIPIGTESKYQNAYQYFKKYGDCFKKSALIKSYKSKSMIDLLE